MNRGHVLQSVYFRLGPTLIAVSLLGYARDGMADPWIPAGDARLRHDLQLLADAGMLRAPLTAWPVSWGEVARDVGVSRDETRLPQHLGAALARVRSAASRADDSGGWHAEANIAGSYEPMALRRFANVPREEAELSGVIQFTGERLAVRLQGTAVSDASDEQSVRPDGSYAALMLGNWIISAGYVDRWWGPGWEGSLILGTNARPMPAITIERNYSDPIDHPWLSWIGQWRVVATMGQFEGDRSDAPDAKFFGMRLTWKPHQRIEIGVSRSAQWCGEGRPCDLDTFIDLLLGKDNDQPLAEQPGNQMAGIDVRWSMPWVPVALYGQAIGEDEAGNLPSKFLGLVGAEIAGGWADRSWRAHVEYADTTCAFYESEPEFGCAYNHSIYTDGYQYRDRSIGHPGDGDTQQFSVGAALVEADGSSWQVAIQESEINRGSANPVHSVSALAVKLRSVDLHHRRQFLEGDLQLGLGYEERDLELMAGHASGLRGYATWMRQF